MPVALWTPVTKAFTSHLVPHWEPIEIRGKRLSPFFPYIQISEVVGSWFPKPPALSKQNTDASSPSSPHHCPEDEYILLKGLLPKLKCTWEKNKLGKYSKRAHLCRFQDAQNYLRYLYSTHLDKSSQAAYNKISVRYSSNIKSIKSIQTS